MIYLVCDTLIFLPLIDTGWLPGVAANAPLICPYARHFRYFSLLPKSMVSTSENLSYYGALIVRVAVQLFRARDTRQLLPVCVFLP